MKKLATLLIVVVLFAFYSSDAFYNITEFFGEKNIEHQEETLQDNKVKDSNEKNKINNFFDIKIGDSEGSIVEKIGEPSRVDKSKYGFDWYVYNQFNAMLCMVGVKDEKVVGLYSDGVDSLEMGNIKLGSKRNLVREIYKPIKYMRKGNYRYTLNDGDERDTLLINEKYINIFYDIHEDNKVAAYEIILKDIEEASPLFAKDNAELKKSYELENIDLVNSAREKRKLKSLEYSQQATISSRKHCQDMKENKFFDHINKKGERVSERVKAEGINFLAVGENIAAGQYDSIFAHHALMNSEGHRKNILGDYKYIGVGVVFGGSYNMYYCQNFFR